MEFMESMITLAAKIGVGLFECVCTAIMLWGGLRATYALLRRQPHVALMLTRFMNVGLLFKLGAEVLRLVYLRTLDELLLVAGIVLIHGAISFILQWEIRREQTHDMAAEEQGKIEEDIYL